MTAMAERKQYKNLLDVMQDLPLKGAIEVDFPLNRKAAGDPVQVTTIETARGVQPAGIPLGLVDFITEFPATSSSLMVPVNTVIGSEFAPVATGALKPAVTDTYVSSVLPVETIAGWIQVSSQVLDDAASAGYSLTYDLLRGVRHAEEWQIINGTGVSPQLKGVLSTPGINAAANLPAAISAIGSAGYSANMVLINPADIEKVRVSSQTAGASNYDPIRQVTIVYGMALIPSTAVPVGTAVIGDWASAAAVWRAHQARIIVGRQFDNIVKNLLTLVGESRLAFAITHAAGFAKFTIT